MNGYHIGGLIEHERKKRGVTQKQLASGIFAPQMLSKLEKNMSESDILQVDILLQRLGRSPDKLEIFMPLSEYEKVEKREKIEELIMQNKADKAKYEIECYSRLYDHNSNVHKMYYNRMKADLLMRTGGNIKKALQYTIIALDTTLPGWNERSFKDMLISTYEMENLLAYGKIMYEMGKTNVARQHLDECFRYIENHYVDTEELAKIYPKCVWLLSVVFPEMEYDERIVGYCEKALDMLRREAISYFAIPVIEQMLFRCSRLGHDDLIKFWKPVYSALKSLYSQYEPNMCQNSLFFYVYQREYHLDFETIKGERVSRGYTQENLIEGIFESAKPLSLIENHKKSASKKHYEEIMNKIGFDKRRYNGLLATESFDVLQKRNVFDYFCCISEYDKAKDILNELQDMLDERVDENRRFIEINRMIVDMAMKNMSRDMFLEKTKKILSETYSVDTKGNRPPTRNEALIVNQIAREFELLGKEVEAKKILNRVINNYDSSRVNARYHMRSYLLLNCSYINMLYNTGECQEAMYLADKLLRAELRWAKTRKLSDYCVIGACGNIKDKNYAVECKRLLKAAYYIRIFNYEEARAYLVAEYYKKIYEEEIV